MPRVICPTCERAINNCLCQWIEGAIFNQVSLGILQHPNEAKQVKGTAKIVQLSLRDCQTWVGENVLEIPSLKHWLEGSQPVFLLYPKIEHQLEPFSEWCIARIQQTFELSAIKILVLDGTWRKTHKIMQLNSVLRGLNRVVLSPVERSNYRIRKQKDALSLSTVEAVYALYSQLESNAERYQPLLASFERMQAHQQNFYPPPIDK
ncbi:MAG: DTW domain-containing protein [Thiomicrorhabdus sp.]|nr:DTW domain-containing protein [Thiomicrorhabdus sp.]